MANSKREIPDLPSFLDQAILDPMLNKELLLNLCDASLQQNVRAICTSLRQLHQLRERLIGNNCPKLIAVIGFPFGALPAELRLAEAEWAAAHGADELDVVPDFSALVNGDTGCFAEDLASIASLGLPMRVILDMPRMGEKQLKLAVEASIDAGACGIQTGNGFGPPCEVDEVIQLKQLCRGRCSIKAAGGIHSIDQVCDLINAGATFLGSSSSVRLIQSLRSDNN